MQPHWLPALDGTPMSIATKLHSPEPSLAYRLLQHHRPAGYDFVRALTLPIHPACSGCIEFKAKPGPHWQHLRLTQTQLSPARGCPRQKQRSIFCKYPYPYADHRPQSGNFITMDDHFYSIYWCLFCPQLSLNC